MALTVKQTADVKELINAMDRLLKGHATQRITNGAATDVTGTTALAQVGLQGTDGGAPTDLNKPHDEAQRDVAVTIRAALKALKLNLQSNTTADV